MDTPAALLRRAVGTSKDPKSGAPTQGPSLLRPLPEPPAAPAAATRQESAPQERVLSRRNRSNKKTTAGVPRGPRRRAPPESPLVALLRTCSNLGSRAVRAALPDSATVIAPAPARSPSLSGAGSQGVASSAHPEGASEHGSAGCKGNDQRVAALFRWLARACAVHLAISWLRAASAPGLLAGGALLGLAAALWTCARAALAAPGRLGRVATSTAAASGRRSLSVLQQDQQLAPPGMQAAGGETEKSADRSTAGRGAPRAAPGGCLGFRWRLRGGGCTPVLGSVAREADARLRGALHAAALALVAAIFVAGLLAAAGGGAMFLVVQVRAVAISLGIRTRDTEKRLRY